MHSSKRPGARAISAFLVALLMLLPGTSLVPSSAVARSSDGTGGASHARYEIPATVLPPDMGQTGKRVYIPETGHSVSGMILDYWRANGAASVYGNPISEPYVAANGYLSQAFERGIFQFLPDFVWTETPTVRLQPIGAAQYDLHRDGFRADGRRVAGDRRVQRTIPASENPDRQRKVLNNGGRLSTVTGFSIAGPIGAWYDRHEGWFYFGSPISEPFRQRGVTVQLFQNGMLMNRGSSVVPAALPREHPARYGIDTTPVAQGNLPVYAETGFMTAPNPYGVDPAGFTGKRHIEVDISNQRLVAYEGDRVVLETPVSTGVPPNYTETGAFHVRLKYPTQDMTGFIGSTGEVLATGNQNPGSGQSYLVPDVPNVMYFDMDAEALHGAYWHNNFGHPMSHGCINLPLDVAAFLYGWAPLGTAVNVHQ